MDVDFTHRFESVTKVSCDYRGNVSQFFYPTMQIGHHLSTQVMHPTQVPVACSRTENYQKYNKTRKLHVYTLLIQEWKWGYRSRTLQFCATTRATGATTAVLSSLQIRCFISEQSTVYSTLTFEFRIVVFTF